MYLIKYPNGPLDMVHRLRAGIGGAPRTRCRHCTSLMRCSCRGPDGVTPLSLARKR